jgi:hypothetical protein
VTDQDVPVDPGAAVPDVTTTDESAADKAIRQADEGGTGPYTVQAGRRMERNGILLEPGAQVWFGSPSEANVYISNGTVA